MTNLPASLQNNLSFLTLLRETENPEQRRALLETSTPGQIRALAELSRHVLYGHCKLDKSSRKKLRKNLKYLQKVASPSKTFRSKRRILSQRGGGIFSILLPALLGTVLPALLK